MRELLRAGMVAAVVALVAMIIMIFAGTLPDSSLAIQPSYPPAPAADVVEVINEYPDEMLRFFAADSLFVLSYLIVFAALYGVAARRVPVLAVIGMVAGGLAAFFDATENAFFIGFATLSQGGSSFTVGDLPLTIIYLVANLKWMAAFATLYAFGLALPHDGRLDWIVVGLMLVFPIAGVLVIAMPSLALLTSVLMLVGMVLFAVYFWQKQRTQVPQESALQTE